MQASKNKRSREAPKKFVEKLVHGICLNLFERLIVFEKEERDIVNVTPLHNNIISNRFFLKTKSWKSNMDIVYHNEYSSPIHSFV